MEALVTSLQNTLSTTTAFIVAIGTSSAFFVGWIISDYRDWIAFGTGGTPANFSGYLRINGFRVRRFFTFDNLKDASGLSGTGTSYLPDNVPMREGRPPKMISRTLPQRQYPEYLDEDISERLHKIPQAYALKYPQILVLDKSITEGRSTDAIYARPCLPTRVRGAHDSILGDEIAHVHPAENSLHVWLTETDCKKVVSLGWGERFPLASLGMVDVGWAFVYAPRSMQQVDVIEQIVKAGIQNVTGTRLESLGTPAEVASAVVGQ